MVTVTVGTGQGYGRYVRGALAVPVATTVTYYASRVLRCFGSNIRVCK